MFAIALPHSFGWRALITNTKMIISTLPGSMSSGRVSGDVTSQTDACMIPVDAEMYEGFVFSHGMARVYISIYVTRETSLLTWTSFTAWEE